MPLANAPIRDEELLDDVNWSIGPRRCDGSRSGTWVKGLGGEIRTVDGSSNKLDVGTDVEPAEP